MENYKSLIKTIIPYILGVVILFVTFSIYLYFVEYYEFKYFILRLLSGEFDSWMIRSYISGLIIPGLLEIFYIQYIKKTKMIIIPIISIISLFFSIVLLLQIGVAETDMIGLGAAVLFSLMLPVHLIFIVVYYLLYKINHKNIYDKFF